MISRKLSDSRPRAKRPTEWKKTFKNFEAKTHVKKNTVDWLLEQGRITPDLHRRIMNQWWRHHQFGDSLENWGFVHSALLRNVPRLKGKTIVHIGSGLAYYDLFLQEQGVRAIPIDIDPFMGAVNRRMGNRRVVQGDAIHLSLKTSSTDVVLSQHFLLAWLNKIKPNEHQILSEIKRVLKPRGICILSDIVKTELTKRKKQLSRLGFEIVEVRRPSPKEWSFPIVVLRKIG